METARNNVPYFFEFSSVNKFPEFRHTIVAANQNDLIHAFCALEGLKRVNHDWFAPQQREELVETHPLAAAGGDDDGAQHGYIVTKVTLIRQARCSFRTM
jgi:hypothetical protein